MTTSAERRRPRRIWWRRRRTPVAFVGRIATSAIGRARFEGYRRALKAHGQKRRSGAGLGHLAGLSGRCRPPGDVSRRWRRGCSFRAVVAASDELALGCMAAAADRGFAIPDDMAVVGFGGLAWVDFTRPAMTTVALDVDAIARAVGDFFKARDSGARPGKRRVIPANLVL